MNNGGNSGDDAKRRRWAQLRGDGEAERVGLDLEAYELGPELPPGSELVRTRRESGEPRAFEGLTHFAIASWGVPILGGIDVDTGHVSPDPTFDDLTGDRLPIWYRWYIDSFAFSVGFKLHALLRPVHLASLRSRQYAAIATGDNGDWDAIYGRVVHVIGDRLALSLPDDTVKQVRLETVRFVARTMALWQE